METICSVFTAFMEQQGDEQAHTHRYKRVGKAMKAAELSGDLYKVHTGLALLAQL